MRIAAINIAENFERDLVARRRPQIVVLYNRQFFTPGNSASAATSNAIAAATATLPTTSAAASSFAPGSLVVEQHVLTNPALNYAQFLLRVVTPTVLHVIVTIAAEYSVGSEFSHRSRRAWLRAAGGSPLPAVVRKLALLFGIFLMMMVLEAGIVHGLFEIPFRGDSLLMGAAACLLLIALPVTWKSIAAPHGQSRARSKPDCHSTPKNGPSVRVSHAGRLSENLRRWARPILAMGKRKFSPPLILDLKGDMTLWATSVVAIMLASFPGVANARTDCEAIPRDPERTDCYLALSQFYRAQSDLAASKARAQSNAAWYRAVAGTDPPNLDRNGEDEISRKTIPGSKALPRHCEFSRG